MRKSLVAALCGVLVLAIAAVASAAISQSFELKFTTKKRKAGTGFISTLSTRDPAAPNQKPAAVNRVVITFPKGTKTDTSTYPVCKVPAPYVALTKTKPSAAETKQIKACKRAIIGSGKAIVNAKPITSVGNNGIVPATVTAYNIKNGIIFVAKNAVAPQAFAGKIKGNVLTVIVPALPADAVLTDFSLNVRPHAIKVGKGRRAKRKNYATTPSTCPKSGQWTTKAVFSYSGASGKTLSWNTRCNR